MVKDEWWSKDGKGRITKIRNGKGKFWKNSFEVMNNDGKGWKNSEKRMMKQR